MYKKSNLLIFFFTLFTFLFFGSFITFSQSNGADLFDEFCADCHSIGEGDMRGPDLLGVEQKYSEEWLIKFINSAKTMVSSGDKKAIEIWQLYDKKKMPDNDFSVLQIKTIMQYITSFNKNKIVSVKSTLSDSKNSTLTNNSNQKIEELNTKINKYETELQSLDKKLDLILEYHKKSFAARITDDEISRGKELFEGDRSFRNNTPVCSTCHNTYITDTLNWNPSALDIANLLSNKNNMDMSNIIVNPISVKMKEVLKDHKLTDDESFYITAFLQSIEKTGLKEHKKIPIKMIVFIFICFIMMWSIIDLLIIHRIKKRWINISIFMVTSIFIGNSIFANAKNIGINKNYSPIQPIKFSHKIHVDENKIQCLFCHNSPEFSRESGIPSTNICMICHNKITSGKNSGKFEINKIKDSYKNNKPIEWTKIHNLPDHVFFSHAQHVSVGKIDCSTCHGKVEEMNRTFQYSSLSMGWCVNCHREKKVQFENNMFYSNHEELHKDLKSGIIEQVTADMIGANDCQKCHY